MFVKDVKVNLIKDSRGERTISISLHTYHGVFTASAPSGKSKGRHETRSYNIKGKAYSVGLLRAFCRILKGKNFFIKKLDDLKKLNAIIERFEKRFGSFGGNSTYILESVFLKAAAAEEEKELWKFVWDSMEFSGRPKMPMPIGNCVGGGLHSRVKHKTPDFQEFLLIPKEKSFRHAITLNIRAYEYIRGLLKVKAKNDESAWITRDNNEQVLAVLRKAADKYNLRIGLDIAASSFLHRNYYEYKNKILTRDRLDQIDYIERLIHKYGIFYIEDPLGEEDFSGFKQVLSTTKGFRLNSLVVGDDLTTTNAERLSRAIRSKAINSIIVKPNQVGSFLEVAKVIRLAKKHDVKIIVSHRSGETMDTALADYAIGFGADFVKMGVMGKERLIKHKRLMEIERSLS
jgi:enolase